MYKMKKVFLFLGIAALLASCSVDDDTIDFRFEAMPVAEVEFPDSLVIGDRYQIPVKYVSPSTCHYFEGYDYTRQDSTRFVYVVNRVLERNDCETTTDTVETNLNLEVLYNYTYVFKFFKGYDENDEPEYLTVEVPVKSDN